MDILYKRLRLGEIKGVERFHTFHGFHHNHNFNEKHKTILNYRVFAFLSKNELTCKQCSE